MKFIIYFNRKSLDQKIEVAKVKAYGDALICSRALNEAANTKGITYTVERQNNSKKSQS